MTLTAPIKLIVIIACIICLLAGSWALAALFAAVYIYAKEK